MKFNIFSEPMEYKIINITACCQPMKYYGTDFEINNRQLHTLIILSRQFTSKMFNSPATGITIINNLVISCCCR